MILFMQFGLWFSEFFSLFSYISLAYFYKNCSLAWSIYLETKWALNPSLAYLLFVGFAFSWKWRKAISNMYKKRRLLQNICICQAKYMQQYIKWGKARVIYVWATEKLLVKRKIAYHLFPQQCGTRAHHLRANAPWKLFIGLKHALDISKEWKPGAVSWFQQGYS